MSPHCSALPPSGEFSGRTRSRIASRRAVLSDEAICAGALDGTPDESAAKLLNSAGGPPSLRRFAHEARPAFADVSAPSRREEIGASSCSGPV